MKREEERNKMKYYLSGTTLFRNLTLLCLLVCFSAAFATVYNVGPGEEYLNINDVPLESIEAGDSVRIHYRAQPYREKWVIAATGTAAEPIVFSGVPSADGALPVIDGRDATTRDQLDYWNEPRSVVKIGGSSRPEARPEYIIIENLDIRSGRPPYTFTDDAGSSGSYAKNAAAIHLEEGENITIRNCVLHDCGNGFFCGSGASKVTMEYCYIYDNGIEGSIYEHNNYTEAHGILFQFNYFGYLREGCDGNNLKDRSGGCVIRYNRIEGGNRQLDLVDSDYESIYGEDSYRSTFVYGNILIEPEGHGNSQIVHYGGDSDDQGHYRKGTLYFYHNTVVSTREGNTTLLRCSSSKENADVRNNIIYTTAAGNKLAILGDDGVVQLHNNWITTGWVVSHDNAGAHVEDSGGTIEGDVPGFVAQEDGNYLLQQSSQCVNKALQLHDQCAAFPVQFEYVVHRQSRPRLQDDIADIGAFECGSLPVRKSFNRPPGDKYKTFIRFDGRSLVVHANPSRDVSLALYSLSGELVYLLRAEGRSTGYVAFPVCSRTVPPGRYVAQLTGCPGEGGGCRLFTVGR